MRILVADFEVFKYDWYLCVKDFVTEEEVFSAWNDREGLMKMYEENKDYIFVGYNFKGYDQYIFKAILLGMNPYPVSKFIIGGGDGWDYSRNTFSKVPLNFYEVQYKQGLGLKKLEGFMGFSIEESEVDFDIDRPLTQAERELTEKYCKHDVDSTSAVLFHKWDDFRALHKMCKLFNRPRRDMCKTKAQLVSKGLGAEKRVFYDEFDLRLPETLILDKYRYVADWFMNSVENVRSMMEAEGLDWRNKGLFRKVFYGDKNILLTDVDGIEVKFAWGGGHGARKGFIYECKPDEVLIMYDVDQLYPNLMIKYNLMSRAITKPKKFEEILETSLRLKAEEKVDERMPYKTTCNSIYGISGADFMPTYDPLHRNLVCVFGQLLLLDLIEKVEDISETVQFNTDGILSIVKRKDLEEFKSRVHAWENRTYLKMSFTECKRVIESNVNLYILEQNNGKVKYVGGRVKKRDVLDNDMPIIRDALVNYLMYGIKPEETIYGCDDFMKFQNILLRGNTFSYTEHNDKRYYHKYFRVYASKDESDGPLRKVKIENGKIRKVKMGPEHAFIYNDDVRNMKCPDKLDKSYYVDIVYHQHKQFMEGDDE